MQYIIKVLLWLHLRCFCFENVLRKNDKIVKPNKNKNAIKTRVLHLWSGNWTSGEWPSCPWCSVGGAVSRPRSRDAPYLPQCSRTRDLVGKHDHRPLKQHDLAAKVAYNVVPESPTNSIPSGESDRWLEGRGLLRFEPNLSKTVMPDRMQNRYSVLWTKLVILKARKCTKTNFPAGSLRHSWDPPVGGENRLVASLQ